MLTRDDYLDSFHRDAALLEAALHAGGDLDQPVDGCPEWDVAELVHHIGGLHRFVTEALETGDKPAGGWGRGPDDRAAFADWFAQGAAGLEADALSVSGVGLADRLLRLGPGDAVLMMAYAPLYREAAVVLDEAQRCSIPVVLVSDTLGPLVRDRVAEVLPVPRGKADHLAMHGGTMVLIEAMIIGLAAQHRDVAIDGLDRLSTLRGDIDKSWMKRGTKKAAQ